MHGIGCTDVLDTLVYAATHARQKGARQKNPAWSDNSILTVMSHIFSTNWLIMYTLRNHQRVAGDARNTDIQAPHDHSAPTHLSQRITLTSSPNCTALVNWASMTAFHQYLRTALGRCQVCMLGLAYGVIHEL